jgi:hypothetical protein
LWALAVVAATGEAVWLMIRRGAAKPATSSDVHPNFNILSLTPAD